MPASTMPEERLVANHDVRLERRNARPNIFEGIDHATMEHLRALGAQFRDTVGQVREAKSEEKLEQCASTELSPGGTVNLGRIVHSARYRNRRNAIPDLNGLPDIPRLRITSNTSQYSDSGIERDLESF